MDEKPGLFRQAVYYNFERYRKEGRTDVFLIKMLVRCLIWFGLMYLLCARADGGKLSAFAVIAVPVVIKWIIAFFESRFRRKASFSLKTDEGMSFAGILKLRLCVKATDFAEYVFCAMLIWSAAAAIAPSGWLAGIAAYIVYYIIYEVIAYISALVFAKKKQS